MTVTLVHASLILGAYLLGSVSSATIVTRLWAGQEIHSLGNRKAGPANVAWSVGLLPAILVAVADFSKVALPVVAGLRPGERFLTELTPVIDARTGPGLVGVAWWERQAWRP